MNTTVYPSPIKGQVEVPPSKSHSQRVLLAAALSRGTSEIIHPGISEDESGMMEAVKNLGASIRLKSGHLFIEGGMQPVAGTLNMGESGLGIRLITPVAAMFQKEIRITGEGSLKKRPMDTFEKAIREAGGLCQTTNGYLPLTIKGPLTGGTVCLDTPISSQFLSGLLFALPLAENNSTIRVKNLKSTPYIDLSLDVLGRYGIEIGHRQYHTFEITGRQHYKPARLEIEKDWSNAAFFFVAGAIWGEITIGGLNPGSVQGDKKILEAVTACGAQAYEKDGTYRIAKKGALKAFQIDATHCPDLFPPLAVLASYCTGTSSIKGVHRLIHKESNRAGAIQKELNSMGVPVSLEQDCMLITGRRPAGGKFHAHNDHRMAMAGAILGLGARSPVTITGSEAVRKSYPAFFNTLKELHAKLEHNHEDTDRRSR
jgi:3-phosphoshikimate 1-carboxyvinyltransferase